MDFIITIIEQGLIYGILALGVYITYKILDFPDLTTDGSFPLGAAVTAALIAKGVNPYVTLPAAFAAGALAGACTGLIHVKGKVRDLLSGIIMMTALWTINLRIAGSSNVPLFSKETIFKNSFLENLFPEAVKPYATLIVIVILALITKLVLAKDQGNVKILGLAIANGLIALAGCIFCQEERVFEISMGTGAVVIGLASVIIGTSLFRKLTFIRATAAVILGSVLYKACTAVAMRNFEPQDMKLITAALFLIVLLISMERKKKVKIDA